MEDKVSALESRLEAESELNRGTTALDQALADLEVEQDVDDELAALRRKMQQDS
jgi:phage shock protein A